MSFSIVSTLPSLLFHFIYLLALRLSLLPSSRPPLRSSQYQYPPLASSQYF